MNGTAITEAMKHGARRDYEDEDLGKFGLGLKAASMSQCRKRSVASRPSTALLYRHVILRVLAPMVPDKENQEQVVRNSGLAWVLVRPPTIIGLGSGPARVIREGERGRVGLVSRTSLADLLVHAAGTDEYTHLAIAVGR